MRIAAILLLGCCGCAAPWSLGYRTGTDFNQYESARYDEKRACEGPASQNNPGWCAPCQYALNRQLDAVELAQNATKRPGKATWQKKRLKTTSAAVTQACPR